MDGGRCRYVFISNVRGKLTSYEEFCKFPINDQEDERCTVTEFQWNFHREGKPNCQIGFPSIVSLLFHSMSATLTVVVYFVINEFLFLKNGITGRRGRVKSHTSSSGTIRQDKELFERILDVSLYRGYKISKISTHKWKLFSRSFRYKL